MRGLSLALASMLMLFPPAAEAMPAADGEAQQARDLMILLHTGLFVIQRDETSTAEELREFAGQILDQTRITRQ